MLRHILRKEILCSSVSKHNVPLATFLPMQNRNKSNTAAIQLPDSMQIIKPLPNTSPPAMLRIKTINKAMKAYLERSRNYNEFLKVKTDEYEIGRHHLANMMGVEVGTLTEDDIDKAIEYLMPSGLYEPKARPMMKHPRIMFPKEKAAQFDNDGRPFSPFFYTKTSNYTAALHDLVKQFHELDSFEDKMIAKGILEPPKEALLNLSGGEWKTIDEMKALFLENINEREYNFLVTTLTRLGNHPYSFRAKDEISKYRKEFDTISNLEDIPKLMTDENGRPYMEAEGKRMKCLAKAIVRGNGTGLVKINGHDIFYFPRILDREQIMYPLVFTGLLGEVDFEADVQGAGVKNQAGAIRLALALCLRSFVEPNVVEKMRLAGLLTWDKRRRARKLPGQKGARAKFTWKKR
ncbi:hypothetical protein JTE90_007181 [Oedothorax gibbosus]|uniref:Small ribosomal subunit protein uS9m n=1 Tax=Oedothorax gibbosus TaxID=931172 RepID=A0AAV6UW83_9ARAC|nr:hypothetical protein JTE90_007181 [Oedothorax gibbosus]